MVKRNEILENAMMDNSPEMKIGSELPYDVLDDVVVFMQNDPDFYRTQTYPALVDVQKAINNGGTRRVSPKSGVVQASVNSMFRVMSFS